MGKGKGGGGGGKRYSGGPRPRRMTAYETWLYYNSLREAAKLEERARKEAERQKQEELRKENARKLRNMAEGYRVQSRTDDIAVKVKVGFSADRQQTTSEFIVADRHDKRNHVHLGIGDDGEEIYREYNKNH